MKLEHFIFVILLIYFLFSRGKCEQHIISSDSRCCQSPIDIPPQILEAQWLPNSQLGVLIQSPRILTYCGPDSPTAVGHFTFDGHNGNRHRFSDHPNYVNGFDDENLMCYSGNHHIRDNPYNYIVSYDPKDTPSPGSTVTIALAIYYWCENYGGQTVCFSCNVKLDVGYP